MRTLLFVLFIAAGLSGQTYQGTMPPGYLGKDGDTHSLTFGGYPNLHMQIADGTASGFFVGILGVEYRLRNGLTYGRDFGSGRSWSKVRLDMAETDLSIMQNGFANNRLRRGTRVFEGKVTWPTVTAGKMTNAKFGAVGFTFSKPWYYFGRRDMCFEYDFQGGALSNKAPWGARQLRAYGFDNVHSDIATVGPGAFVPPKSTCTDSSQKLPAFSYGTAAFYGNTFVPVGWEDKIVIQFFTCYTAPLAQVLQVLSTNGSVTGVPVGARCNRLHVDLSRMMVMTQRPVDDNGYSSFARDNGQYFVPFFRPWAGHGLWTQAAWSDSKTGALQLTQARRFVIPGQRPKTLRRRVAYSLTGNQPIFAEQASYSWFHQVLSRVTWK